MGFDIHGCLVIDDIALALYDRIIPGGARCTVPTRQADVPGGWFLPHPQRLDVAPHVRAEWFPILDDL